MLRPLTKRYYHTSKHKAVMAGVGGINDDMPPWKKRHVHEPPSIPSIFSCSTCRCDVHFGSSALILCFVNAQNLIPKWKGNNWQWQTMSGLLQLLVIPRQLETENQATHQNKGSRLPTPSYEFFLHFVLIFAIGSQFN